jgi:hypothetical protein
MTKVAALQVCEHVCRCVGMAVNKCMSARMKAELRVTARMKAELRVTAWTQTAFHVCSERTLLCVSILLFFVGVSCFVYTYTLMNVLAGVGPVWQRPYGRRARRKVGPAQCGHQICVCRWTSCTDTGIVSISAA